MLNKKIFMPIILAALAVYLAATVLGFIALLRYSKYRKSPALPAGFTVTAHTGCNGTEMNSLESADEGVKSGAQVIEFDLRFLSDGTPILAHDEKNEKGAVTLRQMFAYTKKYESLLYNIDVKEIEHIEKAIAIINEFNLSQRVFFTGLTLDKIDAVRQKCPGIAYYLNIEITSKDKNNDVRLNELLDDAVDCGALGVNVQYKNLTPKAVTLFHEHGLLVSAWTVNTKWASWSVISLGVDNITTKKPGKVNEFAAKKL